MGPGAREFLKALPLSVGLPLMIGAASVKPEDAASNIATWVEWLGFHNLPHWLTTPNADDRAIAATIFAGAIYSFAMWGPHGRRKGYSGALLNSLGPWILIIGGPVLGLIWLFLRPATPPLIPPVTPSQSIAQVAPTQPAREFSKLTATQLLAIYNKPGLTNLQSAALVEPYYGLWLDTEVSVISIYPDSQPKRTFGRFKETNGGAEIECRFGPEWINQMSRLQTDDKFKVRGKLMTINGHIVYLMECEVI